LSRVEGIVPATEHSAGKALHNRLGLEVQVAEQHCIALPPADQADGVGIDIGVEKCHGPAGSEGSGTNIAGQVTVGGAEEFGSGFEAEEGDIAGEDGGPLPMRVVCGQDGPRGGFVGAQMSDAPGDRKDGAEEMVAAVAMVDYLASSHAIFLGGQRQGGNTCGGVLKWVSRASSFKFHRREASLLMRFRGPGR
jgi:hypothetical protein